MSSKSEDKKTSRKKTAKKAARKKAAKKTSRKKAAKKDSKKTTLKEKVESSVATEVKQEDSVQNQSIPSMEFAEIDSVTLERLKTKFINLTGFPIRVMCDNKWAQIPHDPNKIARVLYSVALKSNEEGISIYSHGVNTITGLPEVQNDVYFLVLPEVRFLLPERQDLVTHGELIYDGESNRPIGFKNLFCSFDGAEPIMEPVSQG
tara:strand:- start:2780 stop:3394 length:615 start_codon:yes stop_codon:yes gene_type:complete